MEASPCGRGQHTTTRHSTAQHEPPDWAGNDRHGWASAKKGPRVALDPLAVVGSDAMQIQLALCGVVRGIGC